MKPTDVKMQWEQAAPGWAKWEHNIARSLDDSTAAMLDMAGVVPGARVLDLACGAGSQSLSAARRVGASGEVVATDISETMLQFLSQRAHDAHLENVSTKMGAAEELDIPPEYFDAAICRLGLMLFHDPARALAATEKCLKPGGKMAVVVFSTPAKNAFMAKPMQILLRHAGKKPPAAGEPGIFALSSPAVLQQLFASAGFTDYTQRFVNSTLRATSASQALVMMQEAFGAYRAVISDCPDEVRAAAWDEVKHTLNTFENSKGFEASIEVIVGAATKAA